MNQKKRWQYWLIIAVVALTIYNILPTVFFYSRPLKKPIGEKEAMQVAGEIASRVNGLEGFTLSWLKAQSRNLGLKPTKIALDQDDPRLATVTFKKPEEAQLFGQTLMRAGALIPFVPAQMSPDPRSFGEEATTVVVQRRVGMHFDETQLANYFHFIPKLTADGEIESVYQELVADRAVPVALGFGGVSQTALTVSNASNASDGAVIKLARTITDFETTFGDDSAITKRYFGSTTANGGSISGLIGRMEALSSKYNSDIATLKKKQQELQKEGDFLDTIDKQRLETLENQTTLLGSAMTIIKRNSTAFDKGPAPLTSQEVLATLSQPVPETKVQAVEIGNRNPFVKEVVIDWNHDAIDITLHDDVVAIREQTTTSEAAAIKREKVNQLLFNEIATVARESDETITPGTVDFTITLNQLTGSDSLLAMNLQAVAKQQASMLEGLLGKAWEPTSEELQQSDYPIAAYDTAKDQKLGLFIYAPVVDESSDQAFRPGSLYVIAKGLSTIRQKYESLPDSPEKTVFEKDVTDLQNLMRQNGFISYQGSSSDLPAAYHNDLIFELDDYTSFLVAATREDFVVKGSKHYALLEFTDVEQRILTLNKIDTAVQEDLVKWQDEYKQAKVAVNEQSRYEVPPPTKSVLLSNLALSTKKYFRGDDRKILKWGLDLSGGKTVRIGLLDSSEQAITNEDDLKQASNELYARVNRLGVSEVSIRTEGSNIVLDFPGSQGLSASELISASAMYFNVVNEQFTPNNPMLSEAVTTFLEEVWNEAVITSRTDPASIQEIAFQHLGGDEQHPEEFHPLSEHAKLLVDNGLRLASSKSGARTSAFNDTLSSVSMFRGSDFTDWQGQTNPLIITFRNYALEGANLQDIQASYDPKSGNTLHFGVKNASTNRLGEKINPRDEFYAWTSQFSEEKIAGTPKETYSKGRGWRMAVILNGSIISAPTLNAPLRDSAQITGNFSQREVNQLAADLKAGSLSFTPHILSEENVSPELGKEQRQHGIFAGILAVALVFVVMCSYYRFGGLVASIAVLFNLLIIWGVLQNLGAALTLPGIAGIILALGMAVDANVLVFERIREEFLSSGRLASAVHAGYKKAFTAIVDSNLTTIIAAIILLNFDAGPIKGFALTLIIGILSSMFTALFMTRYFFSRWVQNPAHKELKMVQLFSNTKINFLKRAKPAMIVSLVVIVVGLFFLVQQKQTIFGMDFTGGYALTVDLSEENDVNYRKQATTALLQAGANESEFQIRELNKPNQLRIDFGMGMELDGRPFADLSEVALPEKPLFAYQNDPRIVWIVNALAMEGLEINPATLPSLDQHWTQMSGQLSETMRNQALIGLGIALLAILVYITFRFEFKYAISATLALAHDLLITMGILAIVHLFFDSIQIDLQVIGALMTIVGYSLNDTIIIFDRIREDLRVMRKLSFAEVINHALNVTLGRTMMTSCTTLVVLLALVIFGGKAILSFSLIMTLGVAIGTFSSLFVAAPILLFFHNKAVARREESSVSKNI